MSSDESKQSVSSELADKVDVFSAWPGMAWTGWREDRVMVASHALAALDCSVDDCVPGNQEVFVVGGAFTGVEGRLSITRIKATRLTGNTVTVETISNDSVSFPDMTMSVWWAELCNASHTTHFAGAGVRAFDANFGIAHRGGLCSADLPTPIHGDGSALQPYIATLAGRGFVGDYARDYARYIRFQSIHFVNIFPDGDVVYWDFTMPTTRVGVDVHTIYRLRVVDGVMCVDSESRRSNEPATVPYVSMRATWAYLKALPALYSDNHLRVLRFIGQPYVAPVVSTAPSKPAHV